MCDTGLRMFYFMEKIHCNKCKSEQTFKTDLRNNQLLAFCNNCESYIKNIPQGPAKLYIGKYKGIEINSIQDLDYLQWFLSNCTPKGNVKQAIIDQIGMIKYNCQ